MGLNTPNRIDLVTHHASLGYVALIMVASDGWEDASRPQQIQDKLNTYLSYALDGQLNEDYPDLAGLPVRIQLDCTTPPPEHIAGVLQRIAVACRQYGLEFVVNEL